MTSIVCEAWKRKELVLWLVKCKIVVCELVIRPVWWPTTHASQQNQKPHGRNKNITAKPKTSRQKQNTSRQNQKPHGKNKIPHGKTENLTAKTKYLTTKPKPSRQNQRPHGKTKYFTAKTKYLTAKANTHGKTKAILLLLWSIWFCREVFCFCREVFGFAVTVVGHRRPPLAPPC